MSRKEASFGQLLAYMNREDGADNRYTFRHNCYARGEAAMETEFKRNAEFLRARKNGVFMYHEILSITKEGKLSDQDRKERLRQVAERYVQMRCPDNLVYGIIHDDHSHHLHYHLMISANEVGSARRTRLSKTDFQTLKAELERRVMVEFSDLAQKRAIDKRNDGERLSQRGAELKRRTKEEPPERENTKEKIHEIFNTAIARDHLFELLHEAKLRLYVRGKNIGIVNEESGRKYRLNRLGLEERFAVLSARIERSERLAREAQKDGGKEMGIKDAIADGLVKAKETFDRIADKITPTDEAVKRKRLAEEAAAEASASQEDGSKRGAVDVPAEEPNAVEAAREARQEEMEARRIEERQRAEHKRGLTRKR